jgi:short-subunit dehydrogenase
LVNNAGYALNGAFEDLAMEELKAQYETNLFGVTRVTQAVLPLMRKQKSGIIVNISSGTVTMGGQKDAIIDKLEDRILQSFCYYWRSYCDLLSLF